MGQLKKVTSFVLACLLFMGVSIFPAAAARNDPALVETVHFEDGSYLVRKVTASTAARATNSVSGRATYSYHSITNQLLWTAWVDGSFTYNGISATATAASCDYTISDTAWSLKDSSAYCSGNQAIADMTFQGAFFFSKSITLTLSCSPDGKLS